MTGRSNSSSSSIQIRGTAHPPPPSAGGRLNAADLSRAEIAATNIAGRPLLNEHDSNSRVGTCLASWQGADGSLRVAASVDDAATIQQVRNGTLRGLSLGTDMVRRTPRGPPPPRRQRFVVCAKRTRAKLTRAKRTRATTSR